MRILKYSYGGNYGRTDIAYQTGDGVYRRIACDEPVTLEFSQAREAVATQAANLIERTDDDAVLKQITFHYDEEKNEHAIRLKFRIPSVNLVDCDVVTGRLEYLEEEDGNALAAAGTPQPLIDAAMEFHEQCINFVQGARAQLELTFGGSSAADKV